MLWQDDALLLSARPHGEAALLVSLMTASQGRHAGLVPGGQGRRHRGQWQTGNLLAVQWRARLADQLGTVQGELRTAFAARWLSDAARLAGLAAACAMTDVCLPERVPHAPAFAGLQAFLGGLDQPEWPRLYVHWELGLLGALGYGLDLGSCAATGQSADLIYVSPASGRAVSAAAGAPYRQRLLPLPSFLSGDWSGDGSGDKAAIQDGLTLTGYFLERHVLAPHGRSLPAARARLIDRLLAC